MSTIDTGQCEHRDRKFHYQLIHNGFNDSVYAYCDRCGKTALLNILTAKLPLLSSTALAQGLLPAEVAPHLAPCECGGSFRPGASPRCPHCQSELSAEAAATFIEANAPGTAKGWRWQRTWAGLYCIIIEDRVIQDNVASAQH